MSNIPLPSNIDTLRRWVRGAVPKQNGRRTLESATISKGNLRVAGGGKIIVEGGDLTIVDGNLKLGKGKIGGDALKEHVWPEVVWAGRRRIANPSRTGPEKWETFTSLQLTAPAWATRCLVYASCAYNAVMNEGALGDDNLEAACRAVIGGRPGAEFYLDLTVDGFYTSIVQAGLIQLNDSRVARVDFQHWLAQAVLASAASCYPALIAIWLN